MRGLLLVLGFSAFACRASERERAPSLPAGAPHDERAEPREQPAAPPRDPTSEPGEPSGASDLEQCVAACVEQSQMQATAPEVIEANCRRSCAEEPG